VQAFPVFNGTGANVTGLQSMLPRWGAVIAASTAHINVDEGGAPERVAGIKILNVPTDDGKLTPELVDREAWGWGDEHRAQPLVVSITQSTELGTLYTPERSAPSPTTRTRAACACTSTARASNAAAALDLPLRAFTTDAGVDVLSFGGTKNGALGGEAVVVLDPAASEDCCSCGSSTCSSHRRCVHLGSADRTAGRRPVPAERPPRQRDGGPTARGGRSRPSRRIDHGVGFSQPTQSNGVFATLPDGVADELRKAFRFYDWDAAKNEVRWMCSFDTTEEDVDAFVAELARLT
jgi:threonine aldolase